MKKAVMIFGLVWVLSVQFAHGGDVTTKMIKRAVPASMANESCWDGEWLDCTRKVAVDVAAETAAVPTAVSIASSLGTSASTGTAISSLAGAAATNATLAAIGGPVLETIGVVAIPIVGGPVAVGTLIVGGAAALVSWGINSLWD
jgi:hypothetical protein